MFDGEKGGKEGTIKKAKTLLQGLLFAEHSNIAAVK